MVFSPRSWSGFGASYWLQSKFTYPFMCRNTRGNIFFSFSRFLARFSACERSQNWLISVFWWFPTIPRPKTIAENPESREKKNQNRLFRHINHLSTRVLTKYRTPDPLDLLGKKNTTCWQLRQQISNVPREGCYIGLQIWDFPKFIHLWERISPSSRGVRSSDYVRWKGLNVIFKKNQTFRENIFSKKKLWSNK